MADSMWGEVFAGAAGGILVLVVQGGWGWLRDIVDSKRIYQWLKTQQDGGGESFRSTRAIASHLNLTEARTYKICAESAKIFMSTGKKEGMWSISSRKEKGFFS
ncbi:hypothetical protein N0609_30355 [Pseudomonas aeruginosa]|uniref:hypothetical protein n=1 Tax=Pseudomonas TaxID=286 RepID=UPI00093BF84A|nr:MULTISPECIES: hypothetical protein [Pseudomonas]EKX2953089.1 hypothetical protein [Pseudomonas aeruginosa]MBF3169080.1 hypothetical protein [Pseudomonas aeruginosa]MBG4111824.1 hypothetical protein [Pseudomonas aeruginosa]MBG4489907.1 hypothetical protein [Pseudomonas aeruginosa]MBG4497727.1 hypothetical protein [Pseudomonas aeruginosa]